MCLDPVSLAVIGIAGSVASGVGAAAQSLNNAASMEAQAAGVERDADAAKKASAYEAARTRETVERTLGNQRAGFAANGVALSGSALEVMQDTAIEGDLDVEAIKWNSTVKTDGMKYEAKQLRANAAGARASAPLAFLTPVLGGVGRYGGSFG